MSLQYKYIFNKKGLGFPLLKRTILFLFLITDIGCDTKKQNVEKIHHVEVTHDFLIEKGFKRNTDSPNEYWLEKTKCSEIQERLGFSWSELKYDEFMYGELWSIEIGNRLFTISTEKQGERKDKNYLMKHPEESCYATVTLPQPR